MGVKTIQILDKLAQKVTVKGEMTYHSDARLDLVAAQIIERAEVVGYYYGSGLCTPVQGTTYEEHKWKRCDAGNCRDISKADH